MWPYTEQEWNDITYGIKRKVKRSKNILWMSAVPSLVMIGILFYIILK